MRMRSRTMMIVLGLLVLGTAPGLSPAPLAIARAATCLPPSSSPIVSGSGQTINDISVLSPCSAWAVGYAGSDALIEYWDGSTWTHQTSAVPGPYPSLSSVTAISPTNAWAVGTYVPFTYGGFVEHWNGASWQLVSTPTLLNGNFFEDVSAASASKVWLVGSVSNGSAFVSLVERWNGSSWSIENNPRPGTSSYFKDVDALSPKDVWAAGSYLDGSVSHTLIEHWNGSKWSKIASPNAGGSSFSNGLEGVSILSANDGWAVGYHNNLNTKEQTLTEHWNGSSWKIVKSPNPGGALQHNQLIDIVSTSSSAAWAVGSYSNGSIIKPLVLKWNGKAWKEHSEQTPALGIPGSANAVDASAKTDVWWGGDVTQSATQYVWVTHCC